MHLPAVRRRSTPVKVEVVYALPGAADAVTVDLVPGGTLRDAIAASGLLERHPEIDLGRHPVGVHGETRPIESAAAEGDRIEIYRPLAADPKEARRARAAKGRKPR
jgi:putative ubiquitin-RnfH superfamily antitoxin RatB of RatAB toxin-antitoxin module